MEAARARAAPRLVLEEGAPVHHGIARSRTTRWMVTCEESASPRLPTSPRREDYFLSFCRDAKLRTPGVTSGYTTPCGRRARYEAHASPAVSVQRSRREAFLESPFRRDTREARPVRRPIRQVVEVPHPASFEELIGDPNDLRPAVRSPAALVEEVPERREPPANGRQ